MTSGASCRSRTNSCWARGGAGILGLLRSLAGLGGFAMAAFTVITGACAGPVPQASSQEILNAVLANSHAVPVEGATVVVDPGECTACDPALQSILYSHRLYPTEIRLVYSRTPTARERKELGTRGLLAGAVIDTTLTHLGAPKTYVIYRDPDGWDAVLSMKEALPLLRSRYPWKN